MEKGRSEACNTRRLVVTAAERQVADLLPIEVAPEPARVSDAISVLSSNVQRWA
jgi:hypothetical protein